MRDVRDRKHDLALGREEPVEPGEDLERIREMLEDVAVDDRVEQPLEVRQPAVEVDRDHPLAARLAYLRRPRVPLERCHFPIPLGQVSGKEPVGRTNVEHTAPVAGAEPAQDHRMAAVWIWLEPVSLEPAPRLLHELLLEHDRRSRAARTVPRLGRVALTDAAFTRLGALYIAGGSHGKRELRAPPGDGPGALTLWCAPPEGRGSCTGCVRL